MTRRHLTRFYPLQTTNVGTGEKSFGIYCDDYRDGVRINLRGRDGYVGHFGDTELRDAEARAMAMTLRSIGELVLDGSPESIMCIARTDWARELAIAAGHEIPEPDRITVELDDEQVDALLGFFQGNRSAFCDDARSFGLTRVEQAVLGAVNARRIRQAHEARQQRLGRDKLLDRTEA